MMLINFVKRYIYYIYSYRFTVTLMKTNIYPDVNHEMQIPKLSKEYVQMTK